MRIDRSTPEVPRDSPLWQAAEGIEANFLKEMLKNMRKTVQEPEMEKNRGYQVFREMLDDQYAEKAAQNRGIGLAELIVNQVLESQNQGRDPAAPVAIRNLNKSDMIGK